MGASLTRNQLSEARSCQSPDNRIALPSASIVVGLTVPQPTRACAGCAEILPFPITLCDWCTCGACYQNASAKVKYLKSNNHLTKIDSTRYWEETRCAPRAAMAHRCARKPSSSGRPNTSLYRT